MELNELKMVMNIYIKIVNYYEKNELMDIL